MWLGFVGPTNSDIAIFDPSEQVERNFDQINTIHFGDYTMMTANPSSSVFHNGADEQILGLRIGSLDTSSTLPYTFLLDDQTLTVGTSDTIVGGTGSPATFTVSNGLFHNVDDFYVAGNSAGAFNYGSQTAQLNLTQTATLDVDGDFVVWDDGRVLVDSTSTLTANALRIENGELNVEGTLSSFTSLEVDGGLLDLHGQTIAGTSLTLRPSALIRASKTGTSTTSVTVSAATLQGETTFDVGTADTLVINGPIGDGSAAGSIKKRFSGRICG